MPNNSSKTSKNSHSSLKRHLSSVSPMSQRQSGSAPSGSSNVQSASMTDRTHNSISTLQNFARKLNVSTPTYELVRVGGMDHNPVFAATVKWDDGVLQTKATGTAKTSSRRNAALKMIDLLKSRGIFVNGLTCKPPKTSNKRNRAPKPSRMGEGARNSHNAFSWNSPPVSALDPHPPLLPVKSPAMQHAQNRAFPQSQAIMTTHAPHAERMNSSLPFQPGTRADLRYTTGHGQVLTQPPSMGSWVQENPNSMRFIANDVQHSCAPNSPANTRNVPLPNQSIDHSRNGAHNDRNQYHVPVNDPYQSDDGYGNFGVDGRGSGSTFRKMRPPGERRIGIEPNRWLDRGLHCSAYPTKNPPIKEFNDPYSVPDPYENGLTHTGHFKVHENESRHTRDNSRRQGGFNTYSSRGSYDYSGSHNRYRDFEQSGRLDIKHSSNLRNHRKKWVNVSLQSKPGVQAPRKDQPPTQTKAEVPFFFDKTPNIRPPSTSGLGKQLPSSTVSRVDATTKRVATKQDLISEKHFSTGTKPSKPEIRIADNERHPSESAYCPVEIPIPRRPMPLKTIDRSSKSTGNNSLPVRAPVDAMSGSKRSLSMGSVKQPHPLRQRFEHAKTANASERWLKDPRLALRRRSKLRTLLKVKPSIEGTWSTKSNEEFADKKLMGKQQQLVTACFVGVKITEEKPPSESINQRKVENMPKGKVPHPRDKDAKPVTAIPKLVQLAVAKEKNVEVKNGPRGKEVLALVNHDEEENQAKASMQELVLGKKTRVLQEKKVADKAQLSTQQQAKASLQKETDDKHKQLEAGKASTNVSGQQAIIICSGNTFKEQVTSGDAQIVDTLAKLREKNKNQGVVHRSKNALQATDKDIEVSMKMEKPTELSTNEQSTKSASNRSVHNKSDAASEKTNVTEEGLQSPAGLTGAKNKLNSLSSKTEKTTTEPLSTKRVTRSQSVQTKMILKQTDDEEDMEILRCKETLPTINKRAVKLKKLYKGLQVKDIIHKIDSQSKGNPETKVSVQSEDIMGTTLIAEGTKSSDAKDNSQDNFLAQGTTLSQPIESEKTCQNMVRKRKSLREEMAMNSRNFKEESPRSDDATAMGKSQTSTISQARIESGCAAVKSIKKPKSSPLEEHASVTLKKGESWKARRRGLLREYASKHAMQTVSSCDHDEGEDISKVKVTESCEKQGSPSEESSKPILRVFSMEGIDLCSTRKLRMGKSTPWMLSFAKESTDDRKLVVPAKKRPRLTVPSMRQAPALPLERWFTIWIFCDAREESVVELVQAATFGLPKELRLCVYALAGDPGVVLRFRGSDQVRIFVDPCTADSQGAVGHIALALEAGRQTEALRTMHLRGADDPCVDLAASRVIIVSAQRVFASAASLAEVRGVDVIKPNVLRDFLLDCHTKFVTCSVATT